MLLLEKLSLKISMLKRELSMIFLALCALSPTDLASGTPPWSQITSQLKLGRTSSLTGNSLKITSLIGAT